MSTQTGLQLLDPTPQLGDDRLLLGDDRLLPSDDRLLPSDDRLLLANDRQQGLPARVIQVQSSLHHSLMTQLLPDR